MRWVTLADYVIANAIPPTHPPGERQPLIWRELHIDPSGTRIHSELRQSRRLSGSMYLSVTTISAIANVLMRENFLPAELTLSLCGAAVFPGSRPVPRHGLLLAVRHELGTLCHNPLGRSLLTFVCEWVVCHWRLLRLRPCHATNPIFFAARGHEFADSSNSALAVSIRAFWPVLHILLIVDEAQVDLSIIESITVSVVPLLTFRRIEN
jgi:hypothetical protein